MVSLPRDPVTIDRLGWGARSQDVGISWGGCRCTAAVGESRRALPKNNRPRASNIQNQTHTKKRRNSQLLNV